MRMDTPIAGRDLSLWPAFGLSLGVAVAVGLARFAYALLLPAMRESLHWSYVTAGALNTLNALGYVVGAVSAYWLLRHVRPNQLFMFGLLLTCVAVFVTGLHSALWWLGAMRGLAGIGAAWVFACGGALVAARYQASAGLRRVATGLYFAGAGIGIAISGVVVNPIIAAMGDKSWPGAWLALGVVAVLTALWPMQEASGISGEANTVSRGLPPFRGLMPSLLAYFLFACGYIVYMTFIFAWIQAQGLSWQFGTVAWAGLGLGVAGSPFAWRQALDAWSPAITLAASCTVTLAGALLPVFLASAPSILISTGLFGLGMFIAPSAVAILVHRAMPAPQWAKGITLFTVVFSVGQAVGPMIAGRVADEFSLRASLILGAIVLAIASVMALIGYRDIPLHAGQTSMRQGSPIYVRHSTDDG